MRQLSCKNLLRSYSNPIPTIAALGSPDPGKSLQVLLITPCHDPGHDILGPRRGPQGKSRVFQAKLSNSNARLQSRLQHCLSHLPSTRPEVSL